MVDDTAQGSSKWRGQAAEARALAHLQRQGLTLVRRNYRVAGGKGSRGGEIDLILRDPDGTLVFVEVRHRRDTSFGGAAASVVAGKQRRLVFAARHYLLSLDRQLPCRFDVVAIDGDQLQWIQAAFDAA
jgi:putative endonuclease